MKVVMMFAAVLLVVGGLNWGLVGMFNFDLVAAVAGGGSIVSRVVYSLVGVSAILQALRIVGSSGQSALTSAH